MTPPKYTVLLILLSMVAKVACLFGLPKIQNVLPPVVREKIPDAIQNVVKERISEINIPEIIKEKAESAVPSGVVDKAKQAADYLARLNKAVATNKAGSTKEDRLTRLQKFVKPRKLLKRLLSGKALNALKTTCTRAPLRCLSQQVKALRQRSVVFDMAVEGYLKQFGNANITTKMILDAKNFVDNLFAKTLLAKTAVMLKLGLGRTFVKPADIGLFGGDTFLTEKQADGIIKSENEVLSAGLSAVSSLPGRRKRNSIYLEGSPAEKWSNFPVPYVFDNKLNGLERILIGRGVHDIENQTCIRFKEYHHQPSGEPHILYAKAKPGFSGCGVSNIGRTGNQNVIFLNFQDCLDQIVGTTIHETLHSLGVQHEQVRSDRDQNIQIDYSNVDPQYVDIFESGDNSKISGYGTKYDYYSIMHYSAYVAAKDPKRHTMIPLREPKKFFVEVMGQRKRLSQKDAELVRKMYCSPDCDDLNVDCGYWAQDGECRKNVQQMIDHCPKSCGFCPIAASNIARRYLGL